MKTYICHKEVKAAKITAVRHLPTGEPPIMLEGEDDWTDIFRSDNREPHVGDYFVAYEDDYTSFIPAKSFENDYAELAEEF
jgi:hypothetical protein